MDDVKLEQPKYTFTDRNDRTFVVRDEETIGWYDRQWQGNYDATANPGVYVVARGVTQTQAISAIVAHYCRRTNQ